MEAEILEFKFYILKLNIFFFGPTRNIFELNVEVYNVNWNLQIIIHNQRYHLFHIIQVWKKG